MQPNNNRCCLQVWGWESDNSLCAFKDDRQQPTPMVTDYKLQMLSWREAPACSEQPKPTANNSAPDQNGCLWGFQLDRNCAYKNTTSPGSKPVPVYYAGYPGTCNSTASDEQALEHNSMNSQDDSVAQ